MTYRKFFRKLERILYYELFYHTYFVFARKLENYTTIRVSNHDILTERKTDIRDISFYARR